MALKVACEIWTISTLTVEKLTFISISLLLAKSQSCIDGQSMKSLFVLLIGSFTRVLINVLDVTP